MPITYDKALERYERIREMRENRYTLLEIADKFGVSGERVRQILLKKPVAPLSKTAEQLERIKYRKKNSGREWSRMLVRIRDKFTCQDCGAVRRPEDKKEKERLFDVHHLNGWCGKKSKKYDKVSEVDGLITLCHKCHYNRPEHRVKSDDFRGRYPANYTKKNSKRELSSKVIRKIRKITDAQILEIKTLRDSGLTFKKIANKYRVDKNAIRYWYNRNTDRTLKATEARKNKDV